jgi:hypothetical protein
MKTNFCRKWKGSGVPPDNKYCRVCLSEPCNELWTIVKIWASQNNYKGITTRTKRGKQFGLYTTPRQSEHICRFQSLSKNRKGTPWNIPKEDFLYVLKTGSNNTPSQTRQKSHVEPIVDLLRQLNRGQQLVSIIMKL